MYIVTQRQEKNQLDGKKKRKKRPKHESIGLGRVHVDGVTCCHNSQPG